MAAAPAHTRWPYRTRLTGRLAHILATRCCHTSSNIVNETIFSRIGFLCLYSAVAVLYYRLQWRHPNIFLPVRHVDERISEPQNYSAGSAFPYSVTSRLRRFLFRALGAVPKHYDMQYVDDDRSKEPPASTRDHNIQNRHVAGRQAASGMCAPSNS